jgi:hypothetical protein
MHTQKFLLPWALSPQFPLPPVQTGPPSPFPTLTPHLAPGLLQALLLAFCPCTTLKSSSTVLPASTAGQGLAWEEHV